MKKELTNCIYLEDSATQVFALTVYGRLTRDFAHLGGDGFESWPKLRH